MALHTSRCFNPMQFKSILAVFLLFYPMNVVSQALCGPTAGKCGNAQPCCSSYGMCGSTPLHCGGGCQGGFSFFNRPEAASCYADRKELGRQCIHIVNCSWIQNAEAYTGSINSTDFVVYDYSPSTVSIPKTGGLTLSINAPANLDKASPGRGSRVSSTSYLMYGTFAARVKAGPVGGVVTAFISMSDEKDEIDWEWTGGAKISSAQTNFFIKGNIDYTKGVYIPLNNSAAVESHEYKIVWTADRIVWYIDGKEVRVATNHNINTPSLIQFSVWDGGYGAEGTREWAGGYIDWVTSKSYSATFDYVMIQCPGDAEPTGPPARAAGLKAPTLADRGLVNVIPGLPGYDGPINGNLKPPNGNTAGGSGGNRNNSPDGLENGASALQYGFIAAIAMLLLF